MRRNIKFLLTVCAASYASAVALNYGFETLVPGYVVNANSFLHGFAACVMCNLIGSLYGADT